MSARSNATIDPRMNDSRADLFHLLQTLSNQVVPDGISSRDTQPLKDERVEAYITPVS